MRDKLIILGLFLYASFATFKWWFADEKGVLECQNEVIEAKTEDLEKQIDISNRNKEETVKVEKEIEKVFVPIEKQVIREISVSDCSGHFDDKLRNAVRRSVKAANGRLPTEESTGGN